MTPYDMIKAQMHSTVPFAKHAGVEVISVSDGEGESQLEQTDISINHIQSQHAGALFTLGEVASGAAMAGALAPIIMTVRPVAANAAIAYKQIAKGTITARAQTSKPGAELLSQLESEGKTLFDVVVEMKNADKQTVAEMTVAWHVSHL